MSLSPHEAPQQHRELRVSPSDPPAPGPPHKAPSSSALSAVGRQDLQRWHPFIRGLLRVSDLLNHLSRQTLEAPAFADEKLRWHSGGGDPHHTQRELVSSIEHEYLQDNGTEGSYLCSHPGHPSARGLSVPRRLAGVVNTGVGGTCASSDGGFRKE